MLKSNNETKNVEEFFRAKFQTLSRHLPEILREHNNQFHSSIKMTPIQASKKENDDRGYFNIFMGTSNK